VIALRLFSNLLQYILPLATLTAFREFPKGRKGGRYNLFNLLRLSVRGWSGYFYNDHLCIAPGRDNEFKKTKGIGGLIGRPDAFVKVPGITHFLDNPLMRPVV